MKKVLFFLFMVLNTHFLFAEVLIVDINPSNNAEYSSFEQAHNNANAGDTIYLVRPASPLTYGTLIMSKQLVLSGNGMNPIFGGGDGSNLTEVSRIVYSSGSEGSIISNLYIASSQSNVAYLDMDNITFINCRFQYGLTIQPNTYNTIIRNCFITSLDFLLYEIDSNIYNTLITNCIIGDFNNMIGATIVNNLIFKSGYGGDKIYNCLFRNNAFIYRFSVGLGLPPNVIVEDNLFYSFSDSYSSLIDTVENIVGIDPLTTITLEDYFMGNGNFLFQNWEFDFSYNANSPLVNAGSDGTDIGIFGGRFPCDPNTLGWLGMPKIYFMEVNGENSESLPIPLDGSFPVNVKAIPGRN